LDSLRRAAALEPGRADAHLQLAVLYTARGLTSQAVQEYRQALRLEPDLPGALNNLAWILATCPQAELRDGGEAVRLAGRACVGSGWKETVFIGTLGAAYAEAGEFERAVATAQRACALATALGETNLLALNQELLSEYQKGRPHRETSR
jgi:Flp pilus assembly protein TadD